MFKKRIRAWGIDKKLKEDDVLEAMRLKAQRDAVGKPSELIIRGRVVDFDRIWRYIERRPELRSLKWERGRARESSGHVVCRTPSPSPPPPVFIRSPPEYCRLEVALNGVRATIRLCAPRTGPCGNQLPLDSIVDRRSGDQPSASITPRMYRLLDEFTWLQTALDIGRPTAAIFQILNARLDQLVAAMKANSPEFIFHLLEICQFKFNGYAQLDRTLYRHIEELLVAVHGRHHPMTMSWAHIVDPRFGGGSDLTGVLGRVTELLRDELAALDEEDMAGFAMNNVLRLRFHEGHTFDSLERLYRGWAAQPPNRAWWAGEARYWPARIESAMLMIRCEAQLAAGQCAAARHSLRQVESSAPFRRHLASAPETQATLAKLRGQVAWRADGDVAVAEEHLWAAVRIARTLRTRTDIEIDVLQTLHDMYSRVGESGGGCGSGSEGLETATRDILYLQRKLGLKDGRLLRLNISSPCRNAAKTTNNAGAAIASGSET